MVAEADLAQTATSTSGGVVGSHMIETLPINGRAVTDLMAIIPGMVTRGGYPAINGASDLRIQQAGIKYVIDGGDAGTVDMDVGVPAYWSSARINKIGEDAVQEVNMVTDSYSAEYGGTTGGLINFISKSGTNEFHGSLFEFFRNEKLDARNFFATNQTDPITGAEILGSARPAFRLNQFGGSIGGAIVRDKLFFFANYEGVRQRTGVSQVALVPTQAFRDSLSADLQPVVAMLPLPNGEVSGDPRLAFFRRGVSNALTEDSWTWKIDYQISSNDRLTFRHTGEQSTTKAYFGQ